MKCSECGAEYVQRCARCHQKAGSWGPFTKRPRPATTSVTEWILKKTNRQIATQPAVEAARRRIHGD